MKKNFSIKGVLLNPFIYHLLSFFFIIIVSLAFIPTNNIPQTIWNSVFFSLAAYVITAVSLPKIDTIFVVKNYNYSIPLLIIFYAIIIIIIFFFRIPYARSILIVNFVSSILLFYVYGLLKSKYSRLQFAIIDNFSWEVLKTNPQIVISLVNDNFKKDKDGIIVDLNGPLNKEQLKFIADCSLNNIPIWQSDKIIEILNGKVQVDKLSYNAIGSLNPSHGYLIFKQIWETTLIILLLPIILPILLITALLIKYYDKENILFIQKRVGQNGKEFRMYKFQTMKNAPKPLDPQFATQETDRITRLGKILRKYRIDELPQLVNVIKGEMSLIGPRPEQVSFVKKFEQEIAFYSYRHIVKPGITGWAQINQGYADSTAETKNKLAYDLFYIKYFSFWLDITIFFKTIKTILTGFGSK